MCWSVEVTLFFATIEAIILLFMFWRNQCNDRLNCVLHLPLFLQEAVQVLLWFEIVDQDTADSCSRLNRLYSWAICLIISSIPFWFVLTGKMTMDENTSPDISRRYPKIFRWTLFYWLACMGYVTVGFLQGWQRSCTTRGPWGHQLWPAILISPLWVRFGSMFVYMKLSTIGMRSWQRPSYVWYFWKVIGGPTLFVLILIMGWEAGSFWCLSASLLCVTYVLEPGLFDRYGKTHRFGDPHQEFRAIRVRRIFLETYGSNEGWHDALAAALKREAAEGHGNSRPHPV